MHLRITRWQMAKQDDTVRQTVQWCTCLGELVLLSLSASQLLVDLLQRLSLDDNPLVEGEEILNSLNVSEGFFFFYHG